MAPLYWLTRASPGRPSFLCKLARQPGPALLLLLALAMTTHKRESDSRSPAILVADADGEAGRRLADQLSRHGFSAQHTSSGRSALSAARSGRLRLAIVDVALKDMSGHALATLLKKIDSAIPILMTSGDYRPELEMQARQAGIIYYAHKPTDYGRLKAVVTKALVRPRTRREGSPANRFESKR